MDMIVLVVIGVRRRFNEHRIVGYQRDMLMLTVRIFRLVQPSVGFQIARRGFHFSMLTPSVWSVGSNPVDMSMGRYGTSKLSFRGPEFFFQNFDPCSHTIQ